MKERITINEEADLILEYRHYKEKCQRILQNQRKEDEKQEKNEENVEKKKITINSVDDLFKFD